MTTALTLKSLISAPQNRGGYCCHAVVDNPLDRIYYALSWLFAAASAFVCTAYRFNSRLCRVFAPLHLTPYTLLPTCPLSPSEPHRNLIGTSSELHRNFTEGIPKEYRRISEGKAKRYRALVAKKSEALSSPCGGELRRNTRGICRGYIRDIILEQGLAQSDKESPPLHFTLYTLH